MENIDLIVKSIFFFVNTFALAFVIVVVRIALKKMDAKFDYVLNKLKYVKERNDAPLWGYALSNTDLSDQKRRIRKSS